MPGRTNFLGRTYTQPHNPISKGKKGGGSDPLKEQEDFEANQKIKAIGIFSFTAIHNMHSDKHLHQSSAFKVNLWDFIKPKKVKV